MNQSHTYQPYTYLVTHIPSGKFYYGVEYANSKNKIANPKNIWSTYFTSSNTIQVLRNVFGDEVFDIKIRRTFETKEAAIAWEHKIIRKIAPWENCLNGSFGFEKNEKKHITNGINNRMVKIDDKIPEGWRSGTTSINPNMAQRGREVGTKYINDGSNDKIILIESDIPEGWQLGTCKNKHNKGKIRVNNGVIGKIVYPDEIPEGFVPGTMQKVKNLARF